LDRASAIGGWIGRRLIAPTGLSKRARDNLRLAFPEKSEAERERIVGAMWDNLGRVAAEYAYLSDIRATGADPRITITGREYVEPLIGAGKGIIIVSGHLANWEVMPTGARDNGVDGGVIVRPTNNPHVNRWLGAMRSRNGMSEQIPKGRLGSLRVFSLLKEGKAVCLVVDQRASEGVPVPFFGHPALTTPQPAALALKLGAVLVPVSNERVGGSHFHIRVYPPIEPVVTGDYDADVLALTAALTEFVEARVREHPEQWLWIHRRWVGEDAPMRKRAQTLSPGRGGATSATSNRV
jgi:KDO2-lipid IV(A) lauroyltransferase